jgi:hypothetical protein
MGCCATNASFVSRDANSSIKVTIVNPVVDAKVVFKGDEKKLPRVNLDDLLNFSGVGSVSEPFNDYVKITTKLTKEPIAIESPKSETTASTTNYSSSYFDSVNIEDLRSFDGLNKRPTNRYEIGLEILKAKVQLGADPKVLHTHGRTCLMFAVLANDINFTKKLVEIGVNVNQTNLRGETALGFALEYQRYDIVNYLRSKGAVDITLAVPVH